MLLQELIQQQQEQYLSVQRQIEQLQEQQRQIQAFMQRLGSVESQMESAVQLVQEAIASINQVCPDELENFKTVVDGLFGRSIGLLVSGEDDDKPTPPDDNDTQTVEVVVSGEDDNDKPTPPVEVDIKSNVETAIASLSYRKAKDVCSDYGLSTAGKQIKLKQRLIDLADSMDDLQIEGFWEYLNNGRAIAA